MTKFNNLAKIPEIKPEKKTVFTHWIDIKSEKIQKGSIPIEIFKSIDYLGSKFGVDIFRAIDSDNDAHIYLGTKGDEFD